MGRVDARMLQIMVALDLVALASAVWWGGRPLQTWLPRWPEFRGVLIPEEDRRRVASQLTTGRRTRTLGAAFGLAVSHVITAFEPYHRTFGGHLAASQGLWVMACYGLACWLAEHRRAAHQPRPGTALFADRSLTAYLPPRALLVQRILVGAAVGGVATAVGGSPIRRLGVLAAGAALYGCAERGQRWIARHRQSCATLNQVAVDDALRSSAMHATAAAISSAALTVIGIILLSFAHSPMSPGRGMAGVGAFLTLTLIYPTFRAFSDPQTRWHPRRVADIR
jgi:hypothetical protein